MSVLAEATGELLERVRARKPRVHCLMNTVVQKFVADGITALGAIPSMTSSVEEVQHFARKADALIVNLGTLDAQRRQAIGLALDVLDEQGKPWALDPAHCDYSPLRAAFAQELLGRGPAALRANAAEFVLLDVPSEVTGIRTGAVDLIRRGDSHVEIANGHPLMAMVTGTGCVSGAVVAAFLAVEPDALAASAAATLVMGVAADIAAENATGPGSFEPALLDALYALTPAEIVRRARITDAEG